MADNYLERRMEEHQRRQGATPARRSGRPALRRGETIVRYPSVRLIVAGGCSAEGEAIVRLMRALGCRVAFTDADSCAGQRLAQGAGAQFHPGTDVGTVMERLEDAGDRAAAVIDPAARLISFCDGSETHIPAGCVRQGDVAAFCAYALHPSAVWLRK